MPRIVPCPETDAITLAELIEALNDPRFDPTDEDSFAAAVKSAPIRGASQTDRAAPPDLTNLRTLS